MDILEQKYILDFLKKRQLLKQYQKAKQNLLEGRFNQVLFKERRPAGSNVWSFRINKKYRAIGYFEGDTLFIEDIDDHQ